MMKKAIASLTVILLMTAFASTQLLNNPAAAGYASTGTGSKNADILAVAANPAALAGLEHTTAGIYSERRFLLRDLANYILAAGVVTKHGNIGFIARYAGFNAYRESQFSLLHARPLGTKAAIGIQFNYSTTRISNYGSLNAIGVELASTWRLSEKIYAGIQVANSIKNKKWKQFSPPSMYTASWGFEASEKFLSGVTICKEENQPVNVQVALQYKFLPACRAGIGLSSATSSAWLGTGLSWKNSRVDVIAAFHPQLGVTPAIALSCSMPRKKNEP